MATAVEINPGSSGAASAAHDFDFYMGSWRVHHRRLKERLVGNDVWEEFEGTSVATFSPWRSRECGRQLPRAAWWYVSGCFVARLRSVGRHVVHLVARRSLPRPARSANRRQLQRWRGHVPCRGHLQRQTHPGPLPLVAPLRPTPADGNRLSHRTTAPRGKSTGSWSRPASSSPAEAVDYVSVG